MCLRSFLNCSTTGRSSGHIGGTSPRDLPQSNENQQERIRRSARMQPASTQVARRRLTGSRRAD